LQDLPELELTGFDSRTLANLRLEPALEPLATEADDPDRVEVTLVTTAQTYEKLAPELDELIATYDLVSHVRRGG
jgi:hypothetical protein